MLSLSVLLGSAVLVGFIHTLIGPDHYLPFIALSASRGWSARRTFLFTLLGGLAHIGSALLLIGLGLALGGAADRLPAWEAWRHGLAGWGLIAFGLVYAVWGWRRAWRQRRPHLVAEAGEARSGWAAWALVFIFGLGPCEPMIPLVLLPALAHQTALAWAVAGIFGAVTIASMLSLVMLATWGRQRSRWRPNLRYADLATGMIILACGVAVQFLGL